MAKKPGTNPKGELCSSTSSMRTARSAPTGACRPRSSAALDKDEPARGFIIEQDREIAEKSGRAPLAIKSIAASARSRKR